MELFETFEAFETEGANAANDAGGADTAAAERATLLAVDDDEMIQEIYAATLGGTYRLVAAACGEEALVAAERERPDAILLDVAMPGIDGYETCRRLRQGEATAETPVIFVSGRDLIEDRLKGYDAGGDDYVVKPIDAQELKAKIASLLKAVATRASLRQMASYASNTAMTAMTSMSELGALLEALKRFNVCADPASLADALLAGLGQFGLQGAAQVRTPDGHLTRTDHGEANPLEASVIGHMAGMERIVQFKSRLSITYPHASLLVRDMPVADADRCGRLRDHLAMLVEGADVRCRSLIDGTAAARRGAAIERAAAQITQALARIDAAQRDGRVQTRMAVTRLTDQIDRALLSVALTEAQDEYLSGIIREGIDGVINDQSAEIEMQNQLTAIINEMKSLTTAVAAGL